MLNVVEFRSQVEKLIGDRMSLHLEGVEESERGFGNSRNLPVALCSQRATLTRVVCKARAKPFCESLSCARRKRTSWPRSRKGPVTIARAMVSCSSSAFSTDTPRPCLVSGTSKRSEGTHNQARKQCNEDIPHSSQPIHPFHGYNN
jgi:hypothetical protein